MIHQGDVLKDLIKREGYTQQGFADKLGISRIYLLDLLQKKVVNKNYLQEACKILKVDISIFGNPDENQQNPDMQKLLDEKDKRIETLERLVAAYERTIESLNKFENTKSKAR